MKEILFRGKSIVADSPNTPGHWLEGCYISRILECEDKIAIEHHIVKCGHYINIYLDSDTEVWPETIGQYIGLKDRDGRRIFEGDIVEHFYGDWDKNGERHVVRWEDKSCGFEPFSDSLWNCGHCGGGLLSEECKVIGNIHDNPELLIDNGTTRMEYIEKYLKSITDEFLGKE